jgi:mannose-6-phosphate isomerase-like protein (cupin superfamily)
MEEQIMAKDLIIKNIANIKAVVKGNFDDADSNFLEKPVVCGKDIDTCAVNFVEVPVGKCSYVYHWHERSEEVFYIISGSGRLRTFYGEKEVKTGDIICFPTGEKGVHAIANASDTESLVYIDFATKPKTDICIEPDTNQVYIYGAHIPPMTLDLPKKIN